MNNTVPKKSFPLIFSRIMAALVGGYIFTNVMCLLLLFALIDYQLVMEHSDEINIALIQSVANGRTTIGLCSFFIYTAAAMWVFHAATAKRAWLGMCVPSVTGLVIIYLLLPPPLQGVLVG